jgi:hypothetical protein
MYFSNPPHFSVEWGTIPHNFEMLDATLGLQDNVTCKTKDFLPTTWDFSFKNNQISYQQPGVSL